MRRIFTLIVLAVMCMSSVYGATYIKGKQQATVNRMYQFVKSHNASFDRTIAEKFYSVGAKYGIRGDIALCQSIIETGWFRYSGSIVTAADHNYCGLGVTGAPGAKCTFATVELGVTAQIQHLYAYCCSDPLPAGEVQVDPRFKYVNRGCAPTWESLGGKWAVGAGSSTYGTKILSVYNQMMAFTLANPVLTASETNITLSGEYKGASQSKTITIKGQDLAGNIVYNSNSSVFKVTTSNWNAATGGQMTISLDTSKTPGTYSGYVAVQAGTGTDKKRIEINITATITSKTSAYLEASPSSISLTAMKDDVKPSANITVTAGNLTSDIVYNSSSSAFIVTPGANWNSRTGGTLNVALDTSKPIGTYSGYVAIQSTSSDKVTVNVTGKVTSDQTYTLSPKEIWNYSLKRNTTNTKGYDATKIRNFVYHNGKLYCVYNHSEIKIIDARTGDDLGSLPLNDITTGGTYKFCDVKVIDGHIVACNLAGNTSTELRIYAWDNDTAQPYLLYNTTAFLGAKRVGDCMELAGSFDSDLWITFANDDNTTTRIIQYNRKNGSWNSKCIEVTEDGTTRLTTGSTTRAYYQPGIGFWIDGKNSYPTWLTVNSAGKAVKQCNENTGKLLGSSHHEFYFNDQKYAANLIFSGSTNYSVPQMRIVSDNTGNFSDITVIGTYPSDGLSDGAENTGACGDCMINTDGYTYLEAWVLSFSQGICYYRSGNLPSTDPVDPTPDPTPDPDPKPSGDLELPTEFSTVWEYSAVKGNSVSYMNPSNDLTRNMVLKGDNLYVLQREDGNANIQVVDAYTGVAKGTLPASNVAAGSYRFFSVGNLGETIVASSAALSATATLKVYAWTNESSDPVTILETANHGGRAGDLISAYGTINNGKLYFASNTGFAGKLYVYTVTNGTASATPQIITLKDASGNAYDLGGAFAVIEVKPQADGTIICSGKGGATARFKADGTLVETLTKDVTDGNTYGSSFFRFDYGKYKLAAAVTYKTGVQQGYLNLVDVTDGFKNAASLHSFSILGTSGISNGTFVSTALAKVDGSKIHLWVLIPKQGIAKYLAEGKYSGTDSLDDVETGIFFNGNTFAAAGAQITAYNIAGVAVASSFETLSTDVLAKGLYVIVAQMPDGTRKVEKIAIK